MLERPLASQVGWMIPLSLFGIAAIAVARPWREAPAKDRSGALLWGVWLATTLVLFSAAAFFHAYYTVTMVPPLAASCGVGLDALWRSHRERSLHDARAWLLPLAFVVSFVFEAGLLRSSPSFARWLTPCVGAVVLGSVAALVVVKLRGGAPATARIAVMAAGGAVLLPPAVWTLASLTYPGNADTPFGGPQELDASTVVARLAAGEPERAALTLSDNDRLAISYLEAHRRDETFLVGTLFSNRIAAPFMLATGQPVLSLGGYRGNTPMLDVHGLAAMIDAHEVRFFLLPFAARPRKDDSSPDLVPLEGKSTTLVRFIDASCVRVPPEAWMKGEIVAVEGAETEARVFRPTPVRETIGDVPVAYRLYDCAAPELHPGGPGRAIEAP